MILNKVLTLYKHKSIHKSTILIFTYLHSARGISIQSFSNTFSINLEFFHLTGAPVIKKENN